MSNWPLAIAPQQTNERSPKRSIKYGINDGVDGGWYIAEPEANIDHMVRYVVAWVDDENNVKYEEWCPAEDERKENYSQYL